MKLVGILCWYDEPTSWLASSAASFCRLGMDHLVAVDGAYSLLPEGTPRSGAEQHEALAEIVRPFGVGLTLHVPNEVWPSEVEKRSFAFALAEQVTDEQDWYVVFDADEISEPFDLKKALGDTDKLVGECVSWERLEGEEAKAEGSLVGSKSLRRFYRALRGLHVDGTHTTYRAGEKVFRGYGEDKLVPSQKFPVRIEHRWNFHDPLRRLRQETYYRLRDAQGIEQRKCLHCERRSVITAPTKFHRTGGENGRQQVACQWVEVCEDHLPKVIRVNERQLAKLGVDAESVQTRLGFDLKRARWLADQKLHA